MPRRATTRRPARQFPPAALLVGLGVFVILGATWAVNPFASAARLTAASSLAAAVSGTTGDQSDGGAAAAPAEVVLPPAQPQTARADATLPPLQRSWDKVTSDGILADPVLTSRLDQALSGVDGHVGVVVKDLGSGRGAVLNGDLELQSASLYKLPVLFTVFDTGLSMSEELTITDEALSYDAGTMELAPGETLSVAEALERMVTLSDNTSAILLGSRVGANRINADIGALGMDTTHYSLERMTTSALDMTHLLELIAAGRAVSPAASADMLHLLLRQRVNDRLPRLLPDDVQVAHKTGNLPGVVNDVGILYGPSTTVIVAGLISDSSDETAAATAIAQIGLIANTYFEDQHEVTDHPTVLPAPLRAIPPVHRESHPPTPTPTPPTALTLLATVTVTPSAPVPGTPMPGTSMLGTPVLATPAPARQGPLTPVGAASTPTVAPGQAALAATVTAVPTTPPIAQPPAVPLAPATATRVPPPAPAPTSTPVPPPPAKPPVVAKPTPVPTQTSPSHR